jgi:Kdo2-lipid IVA lauroyltransferase/acyltransferase
MKETYLSYRIAHILSSILPLKTAYWVGLRLADLFFIFDVTARKAVIENMRQVLEGQGITPSKKQIRLMARKNFQHFGKFIVDFFHFSSLTLEDIKKLVIVENIEYLEQAESYGKGVLPITAHLGNWEMGGAVIAALGKRINAVVHPQRTRKLNEFMQKFRHKRGFNIIPLGHAARGVLNALQHKELVALLADRDFTNTKETISFFGKPVHLPKGPAHLSKKTGAPLVAVFMVRDDQDKFTLHCHPPIIPDENITIEEIQKKIRDILEQEISKYPLQWFIFDSFWKKDENK